MTVVITSIPAGPWTPEPPTWPMPVWPQSPRHSPALRSNGTPSASTDGLLSVVISAADQRAS